MATRNELLNIKVLPEHKIALKELAILESESMSVVLRRMIKQSAIEKGVWPSDVNRIQKRNLPNHLKSSVNKLTHNRQGVVDGIAQRSNNDV
jgi:hypothetical protein